MPDGNSVADLAELRRQMVYLVSVIRDPRAGAGARQKAVHTLCEVAVKTCDTALALMSQRAPEDPI